MCIHIPNNEGYSTLHVGNINPMVTIKILEPPKIYQRKEGDHSVQYCVVELLSIDKYTMCSKNWKKLTGKKVIFPLLKTVYASMLDNLREQNIQIDNDMNCLIGKIFRIQYNRGYKTDIMNEITSVNSKIVPYIHGRKNLCEFYNEDICNEHCEIDNEQLLDLVNYRDDTWKCDMINDIFIYDEFIGQYEYRENYND